MSGSTNTPYQGAYAVGEGDYRLGVVFYRLVGDELSRENTRELIKTIAETHAQQGPFVVRIGFRDGEAAGEYWVGFNAFSAGQMFEGMLRALARGRRITVKKVTRLPGGNPNPELKTPFLPMEQILQLHDAARAAQAQQGPPEVRTNKEIMAAARTSLTGEGGALAWVTRRRRRGVGRPAEGQ